jgi:DNA modification methylase
MEEGERVFMGSGGRTQINGEWVETHSIPRKTKNHHPTVKPLALMRYLCRLVTPPNGLILDPFMGSGTTGMAAKLEGFRFIGIEKDAEYCEIARKRIEAIPTEIQAELRKLHASG